MQLWNGIYQTIVAFGLEGVFARLPSRTVVYFVYAPSAVRPSRVMEILRNVCAGWREGRAPARPRPRQNGRAGARPSHAMAPERTPMRWHQNGRTLLKQKGQPTSHRLAFFVLPFGQDAMPSHFGYCISIFFGCNSGRFFIVTVSIPFSILAVRVARSALSGISALMA